MKRAVGCSIHAVDSFDSAGSFGVRTDRRPAINLYLACYARALQPTIQPVQPGCYTNEEQQGAAFMQWTRLIVLANLFRDCQKTSNQVTSSLVPERAVSNSVVQPGVTQGKEQ
jgi:hypothetical protein